MEILRRVHRSSAPHFEGVRARPRRSSGKRTRTLGGLGLRVSLAVALEIALASGAARFDALGPRRAQASMVQAMDLAELVEEAELVAVARVMGQTVSYDERGRIVTDVQMQVEETQKGDVAPGASVIVRRLGGELDGLAMRIEGEPAFENGELVLLFGQDSQHRALLRPVGMSQGAMRIFERDGERWVRSATRDLALVRKSGSGKLDPDGPAVVAPRRLNDVIGEIQSLLAKSAPKKKN